MPAQEIPMTKAAMDEEWEDVPKKDVKKVVKKIVKKVVKKIVKKVVKKIVKPADKQKTRMLTYFTRKNAQDKARKLRFERSEGRKRYVNKFFDQPKKCEKRRSNLIKNQTH
jgi:DNA-binding FrmR family transcriptional regulator